MNRFGFLKVAAAVPHVRIADCDYNAQHITELIRKGADRGASIILFPELCITSYTCGDLIQNPPCSMRRNRPWAISSPRPANCPSSPSSVCPSPMAMPLQLRGSFRSGTYSRRGPQDIYSQLLGILRGPLLHVGRRDRPGHDPDVRPGYRFRSQHAFQHRRREVRRGNLRGYVGSGRPVAASGSGRRQILFNLSASPEVLGKHNYLLTLVKSQSARTQSAYIYCSAGYGESSTDLVFGGNGLIVESGRMLRRTERFSTEEQLIVADIDTEKLLNSRRRTTLRCRTVPPSASSSKFPCRKTPRTSPSTGSSVPILRAANARRDGRIGS